MVLLLSLVKFTESCQGIDKKTMRALSWDRAPSTELEQLLIETKPWGGDRITPIHKYKNKAARSIIPGKNPKTQKELQSDRLRLATPGRNHFQVRLSTPFSNFFQIAPCDVPEGASVGAWPCGE